MRALMRHATPINSHHSARLHVLEAYIETLEAENESLKRQLDAAEKRVARENAKAEGAIAEFSAITRRLTARAAERASRG
jgi:capsule polysaccharide export protein KpsE/RkpR